MRTLGLAVAVAAVIATTASATPPAYTRLSQRDIVLVAGTKLVCAVEQQGTSIAAPVVGIRCGPGNRRGPLPGSYWAALRVPDDVVVAHYASATRGIVTYSRPASQPKTSAGGFGARILTLPPPKLLDVYDLGIWCSAQIARTLLPGQLSVACYFASDPSTAGRPGTYGFILSEKKVKVLRLGSSWQVIWSHSEGV
jgi:hypothetical protein